MIFQNCLKFITISKYHSWYLCQISPQITLLPVLIHVHNYTKIKGLDSGKITSLPKTCSTYMRHFSHRRKYTACSSRDSFTYNEGRHDSYPQFPRSPLGTRGLQSREDRREKTPAFLESRSAKANSTN